jgi:protein-tyrosine phosphatase
MTRILMLCLGNICRSPAAEAVTRRLAAMRGVDVTLDSAGTGNWHEGEAPYRAMQRAALARGYDLSSLRARQITAADFNRFDLILAMDQENLANARSLRPNRARADIRLFLDDHCARGGAGHYEVPDPYYTRDFDGCLTLVEQGAEALLAAIGRTTR